MYLGDYIVIERQTGEFSFDCECVSTGTEFTAEIDEDKRHLVSDTSIQQIQPAACRFLKPDSGLVRCTIHRDSPAQCKFYRCVVMRISDASGLPLGHVTGTLALHTEDPGLLATWDNVVQDRPKTDEEAEPWIAAYLKKRGYRVS